MIRQGGRSWIDGIRHNADNEPLRLEFGTTAGSRVRETVQQVLQGQWRDVGIDVRIRNQPARVFFGETVAKRQFSGLAMFAWISDPESSPRTTLHSTEIPNEDNNWVGSNYMGYRNSEMDELIDAVEIDAGSGCSANKFGLAYTKFMLKTYRFCRSTIAPTHSLFPNG